MISVDDVKAFIVAFIHDTWGAAGRKRPAPTDEFDWRRDGAIDSLGFLRLIAELETRTGRPIDLADVDPEKLTNLGVLASHIAAQLGTGRDAGA